MRVGIHRGASVLPGTESALIVCATGIVDAVVRAWDRQLVSRDLAAPLRMWRSISGNEYLNGRCYPFLLEDRLEALLRVGHGRTRIPRSLSVELDLIAADCAGYAAAGALLTDAALARGWPALPLALGRLPAILFGCAARHRIVPMNLAPTTSPALVLAGCDKDIGRGLLRSYGLPVAEGGRADSPQAAVCIARSLDAPVVLKRVRGANSRGVRVEIQGERDVRRAAQELLAGHRFIIVERFVKGVELRVHFVRGLIHQTLTRRTTEEAGAACSPGAFVPWIGERQRTGPLHPADVEMLECFLSMQGNPSGAFDIVIPRAGERIAAGGAVLEVNVPSGAWYLSDREAAATEEVDGWLGNDRSFMDGEGRVPVWLVPTPAIGAAAAQRIAAAFRTSYPEGAQRNLTLVGGWAPILTTPAPALLVTVAEPAIERHGLPMNLRSRVWHTGSIEEFANANPLLAAMMLHSGKGVRFGVAG